MELTSEIILLQITFLVPYITRVTRVTPSRVHMLKSASCYTWGVTHDAEEGTIEIWVRGENGTRDDDLASQFYMLGEVSLLNQISVCYLMRRCFSVCSLEAWHGGHGFLYTTDDLPN